MLTALIQAEEDGDQAEEDGDVLANGELISQTLLLYIAGHETAAVAFDRILARFPSLVLDSDVTWNGRINLRGPARLPVLAG